MGFYLLEEKYEANLEFPWGWEGAKQTNKKSKGEYKHFLEVHIGNSKREGSHKANFLEEKYEANLEFLRGEGVQNKNLPWGEYGYFSGTTHGAARG